MALVRQSILRAKHSLVRGGSCKSFLIEPHHEQLRLQATVDMNTPVSRNNVQYPWGMCVMDWLFIRYLFVYIADAFVCYVLIIFWIFVLTGCSGFHADTNVFIDTSFVL